MAFKKPADSRSLLKKNNVRVKNSYYTFSKEYPVGNIGRNKKYARKRRGKKGALTALAAVLCCLLVCFAAYFFVSVGLKISYAPIPEQSSDSNKTGKVLLENGMKAFYLPSDKIGDDKYISKLIRTIIFNDCNSVVIDFKTKSGKLIYSSQNESAIVSNSLYDNETIRKVLSRFKNRNISVVAGIYCFEDDIAARSNDSYAVKYMNSKVKWLDSEAENEGRAWLNPYSKDARSYIQDIIKEVSGFTVDAVILKSVTFPNSGAYETAGYPGEKSKKTRNEQLLSFVQEVKGVLPEGCPLYISQSANDTLTANSKTTFGSLNACAADGIVSDLSDRPSGYEVDRKTKFSSVLSLASLLKNAAGQKQNVIAIGYEEYSSKLLRTFNGNDYRSYIVYSESGEY